MAYSLPTGGTTTNATNILTNIPSSLQALRNGEASMYTLDALNNVAGTADAITLTTDPAGTPHTVLQEGHRLRVRPKFTNTGAMTCALDGLAAKAIVKRQAGALVALGAGDVIINVPIDLVFDVTADAYIVETPALTKQIIQSPIPELVARLSGSTAGVRVFNQGEGIPGNTGHAAFSSNAYWDGAAWQRDDTTKPAWVITMNGISDAFQVARAPAGANPAVFAQITHFDNTGKMTAGTVPFGRMGLVTTLSFSNVSSDTAGVEQTIVHNLGTDNVSVILGSSHGSFSVRAVTTDSYFFNCPSSRIIATGHMQFPTMSIPVSGTINVNVHNNHTLINSATVKVMIARNV